MKTLVTILSIALIVCLIIIFWPSDPSKSEQENINQRDEALLQATRKQKAYDSVKIINDKIQSELLISKGQVKRSEEKLAKMKANEKVYLKRIKALSLNMSEVQADSAILERFKDDPDSIHQKVLVSLARLSQCDSVRKYQDLLIEHYAQTQQEYDSLHRLFSEMDLYSRSQISLLLSSLDIDKKIIDNKDKQIKRLNRQKRLAAIAAPVAFVIGLLLL